MQRRGILFLVVGPSGVGKDSLIDGAHRLLDDDVSYSFPQRMITRPKDSGGEAHRAVTDQEFDRLKAEGGFMMSWGAHGNRYGIPIAVEDALALGRNVVVNVSRQMIDPARRCFKPVRILLVTAPRDVLAARLAARGRETMDSIQDRLGRASAYNVSGDDVLEIANHGELDRAIDRFVALMENELRFA